MLVMLNQRESKSLEELLSEDEDCEEDDSLIQDYSFKSDKKLQLNCPDKNKEKRTFMEELPQLSDEKKEGRGSVTLVEEFLRPLSIPKSTPRQYENSEKDYESDDSCKSINGADSRKTDSYKVPISWSDFSESKKLLDKKISTSAKRVENDSWFTDKKRYTAYDADELTSVEQFCLDSPS